MQPSSRVTEQELNLLVKQNEVLRSYTYKYQELALKVGF